MSKSIIFVLLLIPALASADGFSPSLSVSLGLGGCKTSNGGINACDHGLTNEITFDLEWYKEGNITIYSDWHHTSRLEEEDFHRDQKGPSGRIDTWCFLCMKFNIF